MNHTFKSLALSVALFVTPVLVNAKADINTNPANVQAGTYSVEPLHTRVLMANEHMGFTTWYSQFTNVSGTLTLNPKSLSASSLDITIPANTISTTNTKLDGELNSAEWFDTTKYPKIEFKSTKIVRTGPDAARVTGDLTFHGVTRPETLNVTFNASGMNILTHQYTIGFNAAGSVKRSDFGVKTYLPLIGDDVVITISAAFVK